jgi:hypothetical protein
MEVSFDWMRERVGRTLTAVEVGVEKDRACGMDLAVVGEAGGEAPAWTQRLSCRRSARHRGRCGGGAAVRRRPGGGREAIGEAVDKAPVV